MAYPCLHFTKDHEGNKIQYAVVRYKEFEDLIQPCEDHIEYSQLVRKLLKQLVLMVEFSRDLYLITDTRISLDEEITRNIVDVKWRRDAEVELTDEESFDSEDEDKVTKIFRIETNVFDFETPLCKAFKEFNYLLQIGPDVLTKDIDGFKTYKEYKDDWIYE
ncbi:hypothetical protein Tco_0371873 [Tanacetum coccineum]